MGLEKVTVKGMTFKQRASGRVTFEVMKSGILDEIDGQGTLSIEIRTRWCKMLSKMGYASRVEAKGT